MIKKYTYGNPFQTESVVVDIAAEKGQPDHGNIDLTAGFSYTFGLEDSDIVYGLGEANRGINKRGYKYIATMQTIRIITRMYTHCMHHTTLL